MMHLRYGLLSRRDHGILSGDMFPADSPPSSSALPGSWPMRSGAGRWGCFLEQVSQWTVMSWSS